MNHGIAYTPPLYWPVAICAGKYAPVSGLNLDRLASHPDCANWAGQMTSEVITSGVVEPAVNRCESCSNATSEVGDRLRICTLMFECSFSNAFTAVAVAVPSEPRPWVANTIVCLALAGTCLPAAPELELLPQAASAIAPVAAMAATEMPLRGSVLPLRRGVILRILSPSMSLIGDRRGVLVGADDLPEFLGNFGERRPNGLPLRERLVHCAGYGKAELVVVDDGRPGPSGKDGLLEHGQEREAPDQGRLAVQRGPDRRQGGAQQHLPLAAHAREELDERERRRRMRRVGADSEVGAAERAGTRAAAPWQRGNRELADDLVARRGLARLAVHVRPVAEEQQFPRVERPSRVLLVPAERRLRYPALPQSAHQEVKRASCLGAVHGHRGAVGRQQRAARRLHRFGEVDGQALICLELGAVSVQPEFRRERA